MIDVNSQIDVSDILEEVPDLFEFSWWNKDEDINELKGFKFKSSDQDFVEALGDLREQVDKRGKSFKVKKAQFKVTGINKTTAITTVHITDRGYGKGTVELKWYIKTSQATLVVNSKKGTMFSHSP